MASPTANGRLPSSVYTSQFTYSSVPYADPSSASSSTAPYFPVPFHIQRSDPSVHQSTDYIYQKTHPLPQLPQSVKVQAPPNLYPSVYVPPAPSPNPVPVVYALPQYQQAQQLFQKDAQTITPEALENVKAALESSEIEIKSENKRKGLPRKAAGQAWEDATLSDWPENDFRLFCGDLGNEVNDDVLTKAFSRFSSFNMARNPIGLELGSEPESRWIWVTNRNRGLQGLVKVCQVEKPEATTIWNPEVDISTFMEPEMLKSSAGQKDWKVSGLWICQFLHPSDLAQAIKEMNGKYVGNRPIKLRKSNWKERTDYEALEKQKYHAQKKPKLPKKSILHK